MDITNFTDNVLPKVVFEELKQSQYDNIDNNTINTLVKKAWKLFCLENNSNEDINNDYDFIYTIRLKRNKQINSHAKLFLIKDPRIDYTIATDEASILAGIIVTDTNVIKLFGFKELDSKVVPLKYINRNQKHLLYEINDNLNFRNWGALLNLRNLSDVTECIFLVSGI